MWQHLQSNKTQVAGHIYKGFPDWIIWGGKNRSKSGPNLLVVAHIKGHRRKLCLLPSCPQSWWQVYLSYRWDIPLWVLEPTFRGLQYRPKTNCSISFIGLNCHQIIFSSIKRQLLLKQPDHSMSATVIHLLLINIDPISSVPLTNQRVSPTHYYPQTLSLHRVTPCCPKVVRAWGGCYQGHLTKLPPK